MSEDRVMVLDLATLSTVRDRVLVRFGGSQEKEAFDRELQERPELKVWFSGGARSADRSVAPLIRRGKYGRTMAAIDAKVQELAEAGLEQARKGPIEKRPDESQAHFWRLGFLGVAYEARDIFLGLGLPVPNC